MSLFRSIYNPEDLILTDEGQNICLGIEATIEDFLDRYTEVNPREIAHLFSTQASLEAARRICLRRREIKAM